MSWEKRDDYYVYSTDKDINLYVYVLDGLIEIEVCLYDIFSLHTFTTKTYFYTNVPKMIEFVLNKKCLKMAKVLHNVKMLLDTSERNRVLCGLCHTNLSEHTQSIYDHFVTCHKTDAFSS